jgi:hypothetical protein
VVPFDMQITRNAVETMAGPSEWFTGAVYIDAVATPSARFKLLANATGCKAGTRGGTVVTTTAQAARRRRTPRSSWA